MGYIRRPSEIGQVSPKGISKNPSTNARKNIRSAIPIPKGTVALRVNHLQSLSKATATQNAHPSTGSRPGDSSHKRPENPFASIFWREVDSGTGQEIITNSISSSTVSPTNCEGAKTLCFSDQGTIYEDEGRTQTTLGNTNGELCEHNYPTYAPVGESTLLNDPDKCQDGQRLDGPQEEKELIERLQSHLRGVPVPSRTFQSSRTSRPLRPEIFRSDNSNTTTSTMRRQSVRDLFEDRGIERPAGLASPGHSSEETGNKYDSSRVNVSCHLCSFKNEHVQIDCRNCGHHFCNYCPASSIFSYDYASHGSMNSRSLKRHAGRMDASASLYHPPHAPKEYRVSQLDPNPVQQSRNRYNQVREPDLTAGDSSYEWTDSMPEGRSGKAKRHDSSNLQHHRAPRNIARDTSGSTMKNASRNSLHHKSIVTSNSMRRPGATWRPIQEQQHVPKHPSTVAHQNHSMPLNIDHGYKLALMPATRRSRPGIQVNTGTSSDIRASNLEDSRLQDRRTSPYYSKLDSRVRIQSKSESSHFRISRLPSELWHQDANTSKNDEVPEYIECHGYPRTGHDRCGSPVESGIVGECQHCLDDCDCPACESTHHTVRCCTHKDHPSISHFHRMPRTATINGHSRSLSATLDKRVNVLPRAITSLQSGQLEGQNSPRGLEFKYPVEYIEHVKKGPKRRPMSSGRSKNRILAEDLPDLKDNAERRDSNPLTIEQPKSVNGPNHTINGTSSILQLRGMVPSISDSTSRSQISAIASTGTMSRRPVHESLKQPDEPRDQKTEKSKHMVQKQSEKKLDPTNKKLAKTERKILKHLAKLEKAEAKSKGYEEMKSPDERTLLLDYEIERKPKRVPRRPSPLSSRESRVDQKTHSRNLHQHYETGSSATNATSRGRSDQVDLTRIGKRAHLETKTKADGIRGITVIVHMSNDEDMVFRLDASMAESAWA